MHDLFKKFSIHTDFAFSVIKSELICTMKVTCIPFTVASLAVVRLVRPNHSIFQIRFTNYSISLNFAQKRHNFGHFQCDGRSPNHSIVNPKDATGPGWRGHCVAKFKQKVIFEQFRFI